MESPRSAGSAPRILPLEAGDHWWCACGLSDHQPMCDGAHKGTGHGPVKFTLDEPKTVALCLCKRTATPPFCDGSHARLQG